MSKLRTRTAKQLLFLCLKAAAIIAAIYFACAPLVQLAMRYWK
jgi:hypothetical protein